MLPSIDDGTYWKLGTTFSPSGWLHRKLFDVTTGPFSERRMGRGFGHWPRPYGGLWEKAFFRGRFNLGGSLVNVMLSLTFYGLLEAFLGPDRILHD